jgi:DNA repair exonuclease SbcCD ATPase subunit
MKRFNMIHEFKVITARFKADKLTRDALMEKYKRLESSKESLETELEDAENARAIIQIVAKETLSNLEFRISNLVSLSLSSVSFDWPEFIARVESRRNQTEVDLLFKEFDVEQKPLDSSGFGAADVAAFALRPSFWSLKKNRPTMLLDEPFRNVSPDLQYKVSEMITMISKKLGIQFLIVSHAEDINVSADKTFFFEKIGKITHVKEE